MVVGKDKDKNSSTKIKIKNKFNHSYKDIPDEKLDEVIEYLAFIKKDEG